MIPNWELQYGCVCMCSRYLYYTVTIEVAVFNIKKYASGTNIGSIQYYPMSCNCIIDCTIIHFGRMPCTVNHFCYSATNRGPQSLSKTSEIYTCKSPAFFTRSPQNSLWFFKKSSEISEEVFKFVAKLSRKHNIMLGELFRS